MVFLRLRVERLVVAALVRAQARELRFGATQQHCEGGGVGAEVVRHPLYVGWLIVMWAAPTMTIAHLVFALMSTAYILIAIQLEERDLVHFHGDTYTEYKKQVPMLVPGKRRYAEPETTQPA